MESNGSDAGNRESRSVTMVVSGYDKSLPEDDVKRLLSELFSPCGEITKVYIPTRVRRVTGRRNKFASSSSKLARIDNSHNKAESYEQERITPTTVVLHIAGLRDVVAEKAWALSGCDMGGWNVHVVHCPAPREIKFDHVFVGPRPAVRCSAPREVPHGEEKSLALSQGSL
ncbi:unnamed protein product [Arabis nemorensis]|uniref:RRM domain-containing protein n=1 Tax=Arabis nemorensis TaxID=586526 RepID=A0A565CID9_9BRAS|nr:unnamed protein product [Arabis nemorensis]